VAGMTFDKVIELDMPRRFLPKQLEVLDSIKKNKETLYSGAFRAGKTLLGIHAAIITCLENPGVKGMVVSQVESQLRGAVFELAIEEIDEYQDKINKKELKFKLVPRGGITRSSGNMQIRFYNGSKIWFFPCKTREQQRKLASYTLDFFFLDEPVDMDEYVFSQLKGRISGTGNLDNTFGLLATNPGSELHWIYRQFFLMKKENYKVFETDTYDNVLLPQYDTYIRELEESWDKDWVCRYLNGKWGMFEGQIFKTYDPQKHTGEHKKTPCKYHIAGIDFGLRHAYCILVGGITEDDRLIIKEERYGRNKSSHEVAKLINILHEDYKFKKVYCDPHEADLIKQTYELGVPIGKKRHNEISSFANNDVTFGISRLNALFKHNLIRIDVDCINTKKEIPAYRFQEGKEKPIKENDDCVDALRYLVTDFDPFHKDSGFGALFWKFDKWG
jgi:PBSX family phage terminase large subunit